MQLRILAALVAFGSIAAAQPAPEMVPPPPEIAALAPPLPAVGSWTLDLRTPIDVAHADQVTTVDVMGLGFDLDNRISEHGYLGLSTEAALLMKIETPPDDRDPVLVRLRGGVDARYVFHEGTSTVVPHCGPMFDVPSRAWLGARAGVETLDQGDHLGKFAELSLGWERQLGHVLVGPYLAVGVEDEPLAAYGDLAPAMPLPGTIAAATADPTDPVVSTYVALGMRIGGS